MAEEKKIATGHIGNALRSTAADHVTTFADEIFDTERQKYQNEVTADLEATDNEIKADLEAEKAAIMGTDRIADDAVTIEKIADNAIDDEPTAGSDNIVKSGGVADKISELAQEIDSFNEFIDAPYKKVEVDSEGFILSIISEDDKKDEYLTSNYVNGLKSKGKDVLTEYQDISGKVDKVENKSLIDKTIADSNSSFENSFYAKATVDIEGFIINSIDKEGNYYMHSKMSPDEEYKLPDDSLLFRGDDFIQGLLNENGVESSPNAITSAEFIPIKNWIDVTNFATLHKGDEVMRYYFYADDNYTSYISRSAWSGSLNDYNNIEVPSDAAFYKMTIAHLGMAAPIKPSDLDVNKIAYITHLDKIPSYWNTTLKTKEDEILSRDLSLRNGDSFVFITDTHIEVNNMVSPLLVRHLLKTNGERMVVHGGDILNGGKTRELGIKRCRMWLDLFNGIFMPIAIGNHDVNSSWVQASSEYFTETDPYAIFVKRMEGFNVNTNAKNYFYIDNVSQKIRYFFLDCHWLTDPDNRGISMQYDTQLDWMEAKSKEVGSEWSIVVFQHIVFTNPVRDESGAIISADKTELSTRLINKIDGIYDNADMPTVIAVIGGHTHYDWHEYSSKGYPIIVTTTDSSMGDKDYAYSYHGNTDEQSFDVFHIDKNERKIYTTRVGRGNNRVFNY